MQAPSPAAVTRANRSTFRSTGCRLALLLIAPVLLGGCGLFGTPDSARSVERRLTLNRETPEGTYAYFKEMAARGEFGAEWDTFSPNFKKLLNQAVGRNVDVADYNLARQTIATNSQDDMQLLLSSSLQGGAQYQGRGHIAFQDQRCPEQPSHSCNHGTGSAQFIQQAGVRAKRDPIA